MLPSITTSYIMKLIVWPDIIVLSFYIFNWTGWIFTVVVSSSGTRTDDSLFSFALRSGAGLLLLERLFFSLTGGINF